VVRASRARGRPAGRRDATSSHRAGLVAFGRDLP
jgi:hypothetical protein